MYFHLEVICTFSAGATTKGFSEGELKETVATTIHLPL
jgi:hypothetical protein